MRIGVLTSSYPQHEGEVAGGFVAAHVRWLRAQGHLVDVVALPRPSDAIGIPDAFEALAGQASWTPRRALAAARQLAGLFAGTAHMCRAAWRLAPQWEAVCAHWLVPAASAGVIAAWRARRGGREVPLLAIAHGGDIHLLAQARLMNTALQLLRASDARLVWVSEALRAQGLRAAGVRAAGAHAAALEARSLVCAMGIDEARFAAIAARRRGLRLARDREWSRLALSHATGAHASASTSSAPPPLRLLIVARLVPVKGIGELLAAMPAIAHPCELIVVGDGPLRAALAQAAEELAIAAPHHRVHFRGTLHGAALDEEFVHADAVVIPSRLAEDASEKGGKHARRVRGEGMPIVALEALAAEIPLIHSSSGGLAGLAAAGRPSSATLGWNVIGPRLWDHWLRKA